MKTTAYLAVLVLLACNIPTDKRKLLQSSSVADVMTGLSLVQQGDTDLVALMLENPWDNRAMTFQLYLVGYTVHVAKMKALHRVSGCAPPHPITGALDSVNVRFYMDWARTKGYIPITP